MSLSRKGRVLTPEWRKKIGDAQRGIKKKPLSEETKDKLRAINLGKKLSKETKQKITKSLVGKFSGDKHPNWKGGITPENKRIRHSLEYKLWRTAVFERDSYACIWCGAKNGDGVAVYLEADHIKAFAYFPELRFAIDNGRTLCKPCHKTTQNYGLHA